MRRTSSKLRSHKDPNKCCKTLVFPLPKTENVCTMRCQNFPKSQTLKMSQKIQYIDHPNPFPCLYGSISSFQELFQPILNMELKSRQPNNLPLYARKLIHSLNFHFLVNESSRTSKNMPNLHHSHKITSWQVNHHMKK